MNVFNILAVKGRRVITADQQTTVSDAVALMVDNRIGAVVLTDPAGRIEGIVSERDVVASLHASGGTVQKRPVRDIMSRQVVSCGPDDTLHDLMRTMTERRIRHLPVIEDGKLIGIVSIGDVVKLRLDELQSETRMLKDYIAQA